jgi:hypothetical protein
MKSRVRSAVRAAGLAGVVAAAALVAVPTAVSAAGTWRRLPAAPISPDFGASTTVWTGKEMLVFGRDVVTAKDANGAPYVVKQTNVAAAYDPRSNAWRRLAPPSGPTGAVGSENAVWTGRQMIVWSPFDQEAYNPATNRWRVLPAAPTTGALVVWTGREVIGWGGGCCGDAFDAGSAYDAAANRWRKLPRSPLAGSQHPVGAWTGRELIVLVGNTNPDGKPWPARLARAAAYDPAKKAWRRIAPLPSRDAATLGVWDGRELLVVTPRASFAYNPASNRWRRLPRAHVGSPGTTAVWTGKRLLVRDGKSGRVLSYDPRANAWTQLPSPPLSTRLAGTAVWTGRAMIVWGGVPTKTWGKYVAAGAAYEGAR